MEVLERVGGSGVKWTQDGTSFVQITDDDKVFRWIETLFEFVPEEMSIRLGGIRMDVDVHHQQWLGSTRDGDFDGLEDDSRCHKVHPVDEGGRYVVVDTSANVDGKTFGVSGGYQVRFVEVGESRRMDPVVLGVNFTQCENVVVRLVRELVKFCKFQ